MQSILKSLYYFIAGFQLILQPTLRKYIIIPLLINILCFIGFFYISFHYWEKLNIYILDLLPTWLHWLSAFFWMIFFINFFIFFIFTFTLLANIITAPFNSFLAEKVEELLMGGNIEKKNTFNLRDILRIFTRQISLISYYLLRLFFIFILFFIPFIQFFAPVIMFIFHAWLITLTYIDYPTDNHQVPIKTVLDWLHQRKLLAISFGGWILFGSMIPIVNLFIISAAVAGATKLWLEEK